MPTKIEENLCKLHPVARQSLLMLRQSGFSWSPSEELLVGQALQAVYRLGLEHKDIAEQLKDMEDANKD